MLEKWQSRLRLSDWDIRVHFESGIRDENCHGRASIWATRKAASIALDDSMPSPVVEDIILHELLHVVFNATVQGVFDAHFDQWIAPGFRKFADDQLLVAEHALIETVRFALQERHLQCYEVDGPEWATHFPVIEPWTAERPAM